MFCKKNPLKSDPTDGDLEICRKNYVNYVFMPATENIFPQESKTFIEVKILQDIFRGSFNTARFRDFVTFVVKLFNISYAHRAYFSAEDFLTFKIIERIAKDLNFRTKIVPCAAAKKTGALVFSNINSCLSFEEKKISGDISETLKEAALDFKSKNLDLVKKDVVDKLIKISSNRIDYAEIVNLNDLSLADKNAERVIFITSLRGRGGRFTNNIVMIKQTRRKR